MRKISKSVVAMVMLVAMVASFAFAMDARVIDVEEFFVQEYSATDIQPRWSYISHIDNGLGINQYEVTVTASTDAYSSASSATVTATLQQKQANGDWDDYKSFSHQGTRAATISETLTVPYGTYRVVSYHSAGVSSNTEYKSLVGPAKRVPFGDLA